MSNDLHELLSGKWEDGTRPKDLYAAHVAKAPERYVESIVAGLGAGARRVQGGCAELASLLSADHPELLAAHLPLFLANLGAKEPILRWEAACTVGNLASVDARALIPAHVDALVALLEHESIVLQGHAAKALGKVAKAFPRLAPRILEALFERAEFFPGTRVGYLLEAAEAFAEVRPVATRLRALAEPFTQSELRPVATKARRVLKKLGKG